MSEQDGEQNGEKVDIDKICEALLRAGLVDVTLKQLEAAAILNAMNACQGDRARASVMVGISRERLDSILDAPG